ncbi:hypothetical protein QBC38DRAFT_26484 [Podospora fimiseda]|uniref:rRNA-processing protein EFG1 n=1 Tax=Podospora fimiseda TaxID=252190 RepID=A0AAN7BJ09_9PEZI|nr:hypothetical protein QBC38DRAFT_26484 [Podospora fimiseda]
MGTKRSRADVQNNDHVHPDRKKARTHKHKPKKPIDIDSLSAIKKRARAIERLLSRDTSNIPANKQNELERELAAHKQRIEDAENKKFRSHMIGKYHMVRFFERKKAIRVAKKIEKKLAQATDPDEISQLKIDLHKAQVDIDYCIYYPFLEPYQSLYAKPAAGEKDDETEETKDAAAKYLNVERPPMWALIEKTREEGKEALLALQNRQPEGDESASGKKKSKSGKVKGKRDANGDDSDGGFFEE